MTQLKNNKIVFYKYQIPLIFTVNNNRNNIEGIIIKNGSDFRDIPILNYSEDENIKIIRYYKNNPDQILMQPYEINNIENIKCNAIIFRQQQNLSEQIMQMQADGYETIKIKISPDESDYISSEISRVFDSIRLKLRFDGNRKFTVNDKNALEKLAELQPEYIEDPFENPADSLNWMKEHTEITLAADESLRGNSGIENKFSQAAGVWIIKPSLYNHRNSLENICQLGIKLKKEMIFTSSMESDAGLQVAARWAGIYAPAETHGLDTFRYQKFCLIEKMQSVAPGYFQLLPLPLKLDFSLLEKIEF